MTEHSAPLSANADTVLDAFHPGVAAWFRSAFPAPTAAQVEAWPAIQAKQHALVAAPTGSGKTLAAFLVAIDGLVCEGERFTSTKALPDGTLLDWGGGKFFDESVGVYGWSCEGAIRYLEHHTADAPSYGASSSSAVSTARDRDWATHAVATRRGVTSTTILRA